ELDDDAGGVVGIGGCAGGVMPEIVERPTARLVEMLREGLLDAALLSLPIRQDAIESVPVFDEPFCLLAPVGSAILEHERLSPARLRACDMVLLEDGHCLRDQALSLCGKRGGATPRKVTASLETLKYLVAAGGGAGGGADGAGAGAGGGGAEDGGYSLLPALACGLPAGLNELVRVRWFDDRAPSRRIAVCFRKTSPRREEALALAELVRRCAPPEVRVVEDGYGKKRARRG
ncbi:MAG: LysR substrate-binding domain-containing protein, partial [Phycisphaerales bacterium]